MAEEKQIVQKGIKIEFPSVTDRQNFVDQASAKITFDTFTHGFEAVVQNALIDTILTKGSDKVYPERGTDIHKTMLAGGITDADSMFHTANFGTIDVKTFTNNEIYEQLDKDNQIFTDSIFSNNPNSYIYENLPESLIQDYKLIPTDLSTNGVILNAIFTSSKGEVIGSETVIEF